MIKSASGNTPSDSPNKEKRQFVAAFLVIQAVVLVCLLIYYYDSLPVFPLLLVLTWALVSLALASGQVRLRILDTVRPPAPESSLSTVNTNIFGIPSKNLDLAGLCALMQEGVALVKNGQIIYVNPALAYVLAAQEEEIIGTRIASYVHLEDATLLNLDGNLRPGEGPSRATIRLTTRLGDVRWFICSVHNMDWQGEGAVLLLFENIGPLKQAQKALEEMEYQSRILLERTPLGVAMFDAMGQLKLSNTAWHSIWSSIVGTGARRFNILQDPFLPNTAVERAVRQAFNKKDAGVSNFEHSAPWGETRWLNLNFHPMADPMGRLIGVAMIQQDITDQIRSGRRENELNDQLTSLRHELSYCSSFMAELQNKAKHVIINFEQDGTILAWNDYAELRFGLPRHKAIGVNYKRLDADFSPYTPILQEAMSSGQRHTIERFERLDENGLHVEKIIAYTAHMGLKIILFLEIKDISHHVSDKSMRALLGRLAALTGAGKALLEVLDLEASPPALKNAGDAADKLAALGRSVEFLGQQENLPQSAGQKLVLGEVLDKAAAAITATGPDDLQLDKNYTNADLPLNSNEEYLVAGFSGLGALLLGLDFAGEPRKLALTQSRDRFYAIISLQARAKDPLKLTNFPELAAALDKKTALLEEMPALQKLFAALKYFQACGGIVSGYSSNDLSGFTCRLRLPGAASQLIDEK